VVQYAKPLPTIDAETRPFWEACRAHELRAQRCTGCHRFRWPPRPLCPHCRSWEAEWTALPGTGVVASYVVVHYSAVPVFAAELPYVVAHITVDGTDGALRLTSNVIDCPPDDVSVGMRVAVVFEDVTPEVTLPKFRPLPAASGDVQVRVDNDGNDHR
jgi:uncharacterized OB-fold protein